MKKIVWSMLGIAALVWFGIYVTKPPPGTRVSDLGRGHKSVEELATFTYNSNPPTSGPHLATWVKPGVYKEPQSEGELIHSLEHGYIEINYNCNAAVVSGGALDDAKNASPSAINTSNTCVDLIKKLEDIARKKKLFKLLVVPRPSITTPIVLAAWTYILPLEGYDEKKIVQFIDYHRDHGPEQTME